MRSSVVIARCFHPLPGIAKSFQNRSIRWHVNAARKNSEFPQPEPIPFLALKGFAVGTLAGVCGSLAGMGGGFVMIPLLSSPMIRLTQHQAHGTSLFAVATTGIAGAIGYSSQVHYDVAAAIACCGMVTARIGASLTSKLSEAALRRALGIFMMGVAPLVPAKTYMAEKNQGAMICSENGPSSSQSFSQRLWAPATIGLGSGFLAGLFGVGGGAIVVPALTVFTDLNHYEALGTSLGAMALPAMVGTFTHFSQGNVAMTVAPALAAGAFVGGYLGGKLGLKTNEDLLRWGFSGLMIVLGARIYLK